MSTHFQDIEAALTNQLQTLTDSPDVAWPNTNFKQKAGETYLRCFILLSPTVQASMSLTGKDVTEGIFQISVFVPAASGRSAWPDSIADHFKRGTVLSYNNLKLRVRSVSMGPTIVEGAFNIVPLSVNFQTYTEARS